MASPSRSRNGGAPGLRGGHGVVVAIAFTALLGLGLPDTALGQRGWTDPVSVVSAIVTSVDDARVAVDADGTVTAVWVEYIPIAHIVKAARLTPGGAWSAPVALSIPLTGADATVAAYPTGDVLAVWTRDAGVSVSRYDSATSTWAPATLIAARSTAHAPDVAVDPDGNALVAWHLDGSYRVEVARYAADTATWGTPVDLGTGWNVQVRSGASGDAVALWSDPSSIPARVRVADYTAASDTWSEPTTLASSRILPTALALDGAGNAVAVWATLDATATWRMEVATRWASADEWSSVTTLWTAPFQLNLPVPDVAIGNDHAFVAWATPAEGVLYSRIDLTGTGTWTTAARVGQTGRAGTVALAADGLGNAFATWTMTDGRIYAGRYAKEAQAWHLQRVLSPAGTAGDDPRIVASAGGTATVVWNGGITTAGAVLARQWDGTLAPPSIVGVTAAAGTLSLALQAPAAPTLPDFVARNYAYSLDDGATWVTRDPASLASPLVIDGLTDFTPYLIRVRTLNVAGGGPPSPSVTARSGDGSAVPTGLTAWRMAGNLVTLTWVPPDVGAEPESYVVEGGTAPGQTLAVVPTGSSAPAFTAEAPTGVFYVRVRAVALGQPGDPSSDVRAVAVAEPPSPPAHPLGTVDGSTVALSWTNTFEGGAPTGITLVVTGALDAVIPLGLTETFQASGVPDGTYTLEVVATNAAGNSIRSSPVTLAVPGACSAPPEAPGRLILQRIGSTVMAGWDPPASGAAVTGYRVDVTGTHAVSFTTTERALSVSAAPGTYAVSVTATNACGDGPSTSPQTIVVP